MSSVVENLRLAQIRTDGGTQPRMSLNEATVADYQEALIEGAKMPPVTVFHDGVDYWLADGFHRFFAHKNIGALDIQAEVHQGTKRDAILHSVGANASHGLRRTNEDKRKAAMTLLEDAEWGKWSDREIARVCGVSNDFVSRLRKDSLSSNDSKDARAERTYTTKHGTEAVMNTANIGKKKADAPAVPAPMANDHASVETERHRVRNSISGAPPDTGVPADTNPKKKVIDLATELAELLNPDSYPEGEEHDALVVLHSTLGKMFGDEIEMQIDALTRECDRLTEENQKLQSVAGTDLGQKLIAAKEKLLAVEFTRNRLQQENAELRQKADGLEQQLRRLRRDS